MNVKDFPLRNKIMDSGIEDGITWVTAEAPRWGAVNGYVRIEGPHPWKDVEETYDIDTTVPFGSITFRECDWFGFDTLHTGQSWPDSPLKYPDDTQMTSELVTEWAKQLARDAASAARAGNYSN